MPINFKELNRVRFHNRNATDKHETMKFLTALTLFKSGYHVYTEYVVGCKVCDLIALNNKTRLAIEFESNLEKQREDDLISYYTEKGYLPYVLDLKKYSTEMNEMISQIKTTLGL